jgi:hypothetical protein
MTAGYRGGVTVRWSPDSCLPSSTRVAYTSRPEMVAPVRCRSVARHMWPKVAPTAATEVVAATCGSSPIATCPRCSASGTTPSAGRPTGCTGPRRRCPRARSSATRRAPSWPTSCTRGTAGWQRPAGVAGAATPGSSPTVVAPRRSPSRARSGRSAGSAWSSSSWPTSPSSGSPTSARARSSQ